MSDLAEHQFTKDMKDVADTIGVEVAQNLVDTLPGLEVKIPKVWSPDSVLALLDRKTADVLIKFYPGDILYVPTMKFSAETRPAAIRLHAQGRSNRQIALELKVTERHIRNLLNSEPRLKKHDHRQIDMFASSEDR